MANTITRTTTASCTSNGYKYNGEIAYFNNSISSGSTASVTVTKITMTVAGIKSWSGKYRFTLYMNGYNIGTTPWHDDSAPASGATITDTLTLGSGKNVAIQDAINDIHLAVETQGSTYFYRYNETSPVNGGTKVTITAEASVGDPSAPSTVKLNNISGDIHVLAGSSVTLSWSGASAGSNNPITGYEVFRGGSSVGTTSSTSMSVSCPSAGSSYTYTVKTIGSRSSSGASTGRTVYAYSNPNAPSRVDVSESIADAGDYVRLTWSGASNGSGNSIVGYMIYRSTDVATGYEVYGSQISGTAADVPAHEDMGVTYFYKVQAVGQYSSSGLSDAYAELTTRIYTNVIAPATVVCTPVVTQIGGMATLSWSVGEGGTNTTVIGYRVYYSSSLDGEYEIYDDVAGTSLNVFAPDTEGATYFFKVQSLAQKEAFDSDLSTAYATLSIPLPPNDPIIKGTTSGKSYNPRPRILATIPSATTPGVLQSISISGWSASRSALPEGEKVVLRKDNGYVSSGTYSVSVVNSDNFNVQSSVGVDVKYQNQAWTDNPVEAGTTAIKAAHINELRQAIDDIRAWYGMEAYEWSEEIIAGVTSSVNWAGHAIEIKEQIEEIQAFVNNWDITNQALDISLPVISTFYAPKASVINALRDAVCLL